MLLPHRPLICWLHTVVASIFLSFTTCAEMQILAPHSLAKPVKERSLTFNVMAPLYLNTEQAWREFESRLLKARSMGIDGVSVDVWWGVAEREADQVFDWSYYHKMARLLKKHRMQWIPIMAFHQCGGNVGDDCDIPLPAWAIAAIAGASVESLQFQSELGNVTSESLAFWHSPNVRKSMYAQYTEFMQAFEAEFAPYQDMIQELNVSMGPAGELRYPSYNAHDPDAKFPSRGRFQGFGPLAQQSFREFLAQEYADIDTLNKAWRSDFHGFDNITYQYKFDRHFDRQTSYFSVFMQDYLRWYHQSLMDHGRRMLTAALQGFSGPFKRVPLGYKIPGIHWQMANQGTMRRSAELAAGIIPPGQHDRDNQWGYADILLLAQGFERKYQREVIVHFTALEMVDRPFAPSFSKAKTLVSWLGQSAEALGVKIKGENALAAGVHSEAGWQNIRDALANHHYAGLTVLRINDVVSLAQESVGQREYAELIQWFRHEKH